MALRGSLRQIIEAIPAEWKGTTFKNSELLGREEFSLRLSKLVASKAQSRQVISSDDLTKLGNAEDYLRVASNVSTTLELLLAQDKGLDVAQVFSFSSTRMPVVAVLLTAKRSVSLLYEGAAPFSALQEDSLRMFCGQFKSYKWGASIPPNTVSVWVRSKVPSDVDAVVEPHALYIRNTELIAPSDVMVVRKRMAIPLTTPAALAMMQAQCSPAIQSVVPQFSAAGLAEFNAHLQILCGTAVNTQANPVTCASGLPSLASLWLALLTRGGADIVMCSTAYGGSSQLTDILTARSPELLRKHTFDLQGDNSMNANIGATLKTLAKRKDLLPVTLVFVEIPTNPDMKVPDLKQLVADIEAYRKASTKQVAVLVDTTFAPNCGILRQLQELAPHLAALVFISMSKAVSRGLTTAGAIIANHTQAATDLLQTVHQMATLLDVVATPDQIQILVDNHKGVEARSAKAYAVAVAAGNALVDAVQTHCKQHMSLAFVTETQAALGFTTPTFSFNLPVLPGASADENEALAQRYVDLLCVRSKLFKPCVSFGQDNGLVYATVPATSTQGAIKAEDKAKQAVGGVQLVRLSFAPSSDIELVSRHLADSVKAVYAPAPHSKL